MLAFGERGKLGYPEKNLSEQRREPAMNSLNPRMVQTPGFEPRATLEGGECSQQLFATLAPIHHKFEPAT